MKREKKREYRSSRTEFTVAIAFVILTARFLYAFYAIKPAMRVSELDNYEYRIRIPCNVSMDVEHFNLFALNPRIDPSTRNLCQLSCRVSRSDE